MAEGIESRSQLECLATLNCDLGQGFLFAKPLDAHGIEALLSRQAPERWPATDTPKRTPLRVLDGGRLSA